MNFISDQHLGVCAVPSTVARGTEHESARRVDVQTRNDTRSGGSGDNEEWNGRVLESARLAQIIQSEDVV